MQLRVLALAAAIALTGCSEDEALENTGTPGGDVPNHLDGEYLSVYVPTTPNPTGGYFVMLRKSDCIELRMTVDEALRYVISMGVVVPPAPAAGSAPAAPTLPQ